MPRGTGFGAVDGGTGTGWGRGAIVGGAVAGAEAEATGSSATGGGGAPGVTAHQRPADTNRAAPRAGSHIGVFGSSSAGEEAEACGSLMARTFYHTWAGRNPLPSARALHPGSAMIVSVKHHLLPGLFAAAVVCVATPALAQPPLPPLPGSGNDAAPAAAAPAAPTPQQLYEHVRRGLVVLEKNGLPVAIGTVLGTDGRIITALSGLGGGDGADVLYADGTTVHAKVGQSDRGSDLALLIPQAGATASKWVDGLAASSVDPTTAPLRAMVPTKGARLAPAEADVKGKADAHGHDGQSLQQMLDIAVKGPLFAGAPVLDASGDVVAVLVRACKGAAAAAPADAWGAWGSAPQAASKAAACTPVVVGAPVAAIRSFLTSQAAAAPAVVAAPPWLGIRGEPQAAGSVHGVQVMAVAPQSPAETAGLKPSADVIAAVDGESVDTPAKLSEAIGKHAVGDTVKLLVFGQGKFREVAVVLRAAP